MSGRTITRIAGAALLATLTATACTPKEQTSMDQQQSAQILRTEMSQMAEALGTTVRERREEFLPCDPAKPAEGSYVTMTMQFISTPAQISGARAGYLSELERRGWRITGAAGAAESSWTAHEARGFDLTAILRPTGESFIGGSGPCLPTTAGTPTLTPTAR